MASSPTTMVITMAGFGSRFRDAGYQQPKYMIEARGATLFEWSLRSLDRFIQAGSPFIFVVRADEAAESFIQSRAKVIGLENVSIIELGAPTDGQATTARVAVDCARSDAPLAIFNIDTAIRPGLLNPSSARGAGWIPCFKAPGGAWSFVRLNEDGAAVEVREKQRISEHATVGLYWFESASLFREAYDLYFSVGGREERGERYVAPIYNQLISDGRLVTIESIPFGAVTPLGTPAELRRFLDQGVRD